MAVNKILYDRRLWIITIVVFVLLLTFFDPNNLLNRWRLKEQIRELNVQKSYYMERIAEDSTLLQRLKDNDFLEQYARERYLMKRDGEQIYVISE